MHFFVLVDDIRFQCTGVAEKELTYIMWMLCVELLSVSLEGCFGIIRRRREATVCGRQILTSTDGLLTEIIKMFIMAVDP